VVADPPMTAATALEAAAERLRAAGVADARREAARLAEGAWTLPPGQARLQRERLLTTVEIEQLDQLVQRRAGGEPLSHVTGEAGFRRLVLRSDRRALIPRPETEGLVALVLERMAGGIAADVCTGSGCVALALAQEGRYDRVIGTDCSEAALTLARENASLQGLHVDWRLGNLVEPLHGERVNVLVANPPYLTAAEYASLDQSVRRWEPRLALESGEDGLSATRDLLREAPAVVGPGGWIALEVDAERAAAVAALAAGFGWIEPVVHQDLYGRARFVLARRSETS